MSKATALTFAAAAVLLTACFAISEYGYRIVASQMAAEGLPEFTMSHGYEAERESWGRLASFMGLLAVSVSIAGTMLWDRETRPESEHASILGLETRAAGRIVRASSARKSAVNAEIQRYRINQRSVDAESRTPLERVIFRE